ncbi:Rho GTPase activation protein, partial [Spinellus fusiger]
MVYENFYHGIAHDQLFGVPLEELGKQTPDKVPLFVRQVLDTIAQGVKETPLEDKISLWSTPVALSTVHTARAEMNMDSRRLEPALVDSYSPGLLVAVLRLFLLELPEPLMTYDLYESVCALYTNDNQDESLRLLPLSHLIATLPASHFYTLDLLLSHIDSHLQTCQGRSLEETSQCLGPIFLRARTESLATLTSQVPFQLTRDLLQHYKHIFSENTRHSFAENEKRRQTRPLVKAGSFVEGDSKKNGLMSFMRPTEDTPKWGMPSVMGVFQRSPYSPILPTTDTRTYVPTSLHFGSAITQTSPPSSPALSPTQDPFVMFDLEDHLFTSSTDKDTAAIATATATTTAAEGELDPFFAD